VHSQALSAVKEINNINARAYFMIGSSAKRLIAGRI